MRFQGSPRLLSACAAILLAQPIALHAAPRTWSYLQQTINGEYVSSTADTVMVRRTDGQALRLKLTDLGEADRAFVSQKQAEEKEANKIDATLKGEIVWRLPSWSSLGWSNDQESEIWLWDDQLRKPTEKLTAVVVHYTNNQRNRNQFEGTFETPAPVHITKTARVVLKARFKTSVNGKDRVLEELSAPATLPMANKGQIKLPSVRFTITG